MQPRVEATSPLPASIIHIISPRSPHQPLYTYKHTSHRDFIYARRRRAWTSYEWWPGLWLLPCSVNAVFPPLPTPRSSLGYYAPFDGALIIPTLRPRPYFHRDHTR